MSHKQSKRDREKLELTEENLTRAEKHRREQGLTLKYKIKETDEHKGIQE